MMVRMAPETSTLADIGTDHAILLAELVKTGKIKQGIGVEIAQGPYQRAVANIELWGLTLQLQMRMGDGLAPLAPGEATACAIAGMGGLAIIRILEQHLVRAQEMEWLLLQPMTGERQLRYFLQEHDWKIVEEELVEERGLIYQIMRVQGGYMPELKEEEAEFGPCLLAGGHPLLGTLLAQRIKELQGIVSALARASSEESQRKKRELLEQIRKWELIT